MHPYELLLALEGIKHRTTKVRSPRTNGFVGRMNSRLLEERFRVQGRTKWYTSPDEFQRDLDNLMASYNFPHTHQGYRVAGRTPARALYDLIAQHRKTRRQACTRDHPRTEENIQPARWFGTGRAIPTWLHLSDERTTIFQTREPNEATKARSETPPDT
jgi:hypothetical protein